MKGYIKIGCVLLICCFVLSYVQAQNFPYVHYTTKEGLVNSSVFCCYQDHQGFMWFGTENGVSRFDGNTFKNYTVADGLPGNIVLSIDEDENKKLYFGVKGKGIVSINNDSIIEIYKDTFGFSENKFLKVIRDTAYTLSNMGIFITDLKRGKRKSIGASNMHMNRFDLYYLTKMKNGQILACLSFGLFIIKMDSLYSYCIPSMPGSDIHSVYQEKDTIWFGSLGKVYKYYNNNVAQVKVSKSFNLSPIDNFLVDKRGYKWLCASNSKKIVCIANNEIVDINKLIGIENVSCTSLNEDSEGNIWIGTFNEGVFCINHFYLDILDKVNGIYNKYITSFSWLDSTNVLVGTNNGLFNYNTIEKRIENIYPESAPLYVRNINSDNPLKIMVSIPSAIKSSDIQPVKYCVYKKHNLRILYKSAGLLFKDSLLVTGGWKGDVSITNCNNGLTHTIDLLHSEKNGIRINDFTSNNIDTIWVATNNGLYLIIYNDGLYIFKHLDNKYLDCSVNHIFIKGNDDIWFCTDKGLTIYNKGIWKYISDVNGTHLGGITSIAFDKKGNAWVGTLSGLYLISKNNLRMLDFNNGLPDNQINALLYDKYHNQLIIGTSKGIATLDIEAYNKVLYQPPTVILLDLNSPTHKYNIHNRLAFPYSERTFIIGFTAISLGLSHQLLFQYSIDGNTWVETPGRVLQLIDQSYGSHKVQLRCGFGNNEWSKPTVLDFMIQTPYWATWWFIGIMFLIGLCILGYITWWRINSIRKITLERISNNNHINELRQQALAASMNPHFIFNSLNSIQHFINAKEPQEASDYLGKFARLIRKTVDLSGNTFITLKEEMERLEGYLELEKLRLNHLLSYDINVELSINTNQFLIPNMVIQPFVENAIWHGILPTHKAGTVIITVTEETDFVCVEIKDNGIGFNNSPKKKNHISKGMSIVRERLKSIMPDVKEADIIQITDMSEATPKHTGTRVLVRFLKKTKGPT